MNETLMQIFYITGTVYFVISLIIFIGLAIGFWYAYQKIQSLEEKITSALHQPRVSNESLNTITTMGTSFVVNTLYRFVKKKFLNK
ncbi:MAG: hypothetical protein M3Q81_02310 [bacterium]|nr:hypothetical protein [bacterium]